MKFTLKSDNIFKTVCLACGAAVLILLAGFFIQLLWASSEAWS